MATESWPRRLASLALDLLFPPHCVACHRVGEWFCAECRASVDAIHPPVCPRCGLPLKATRPAREHRCERHQSPLDGIRSVAFHSEPLRTAIHQLKYNDVRVLSRSLGTMMSEAWLAHYAPQFQPEAIIPVPLHARRERARGFNQSELLARQLAAGIGVPLVCDALVRTRFTAPQVELDARQRQSNVHGAFRASRERVSGSRVLLVDDVLTSGATLAACCAALREAGVPSVWAYTLARARS